MKEVIIACENLKDEIEYIKNELGINDDVIYIESQLHNNPKKLNERIQSEIDKYKEAEDIILLFGLCGNGILGLTSQNANLIIPKVDDCISLYLGGINKRKNLNKSMATYFLTKRYVENDLSLYNEMKTMKEKYGDKKARKIYKMLFEKYEYIRTIKTQTYDEEEIMDKVNEMCEMFNLKYESVNADLNILYNILNKKYEEDIIMVKKNEKITMDHFEV